MSTQQWIIYVNKQELESLPESDCYLYHNYLWKKHPAFEHVLECVFKAEEYNNAAEVYHELRKLHLPSLTKNWS